MKWITTLLLLLFVCTSSAQNNSVTVSMGGIGDIKVGMKKQELEKLLNRSLPLKNLLKKEWERDTVQINHKDLQAQVVLDKSILDENKSDIIVYEIRSSAPQLKTRSGIGISDDKLKIISAYEGYMIHIVPEYESNNTVKSKTKSMILLYSDESDRMIIFYLTNNKVTGMSVMFNEGC